MADSDMIITLASNANADMFPNNKIHSFTTRLGRRIDFGDYRAGMLNIQYPLTWYDVERGAYTVKFPDGASQEFTVSPGRYGTMDNFVAELAVQLVTVVGEDTITFAYDAYRMKVILIVLKEGYELTINQTLANVLGFRTKHFTPGAYWGESFADVNEGMTSLFFYCNVVQPQLVGDAMVPLLRVVPLKGDRDYPYRYHEFQTVQYVPLVNDTSDIIEIYIRRDNGEPVSFKTGKVIVTLRLERIRQ
jgi:hypothetical protein